VGIDLARISRKFGFLLIVMLGWLSLGLLARAALAAPGATTWYVNAATGNDANNCISPATACLTVGQAVSRAVDGDTIQVAAGTYIESLDISLAITIQGAGASNTFLDGNHTQRVLQATGIAQITLADLTIRNGSTSDLGGGGINNGGVLSLQSVTVMNNSSNQYGGGIFNSGDLTLHNSQVISNTSAAGGGGVMIWSNGVMTVTKSLIADNASSQGGGIFSLNTLYIEDSTLSGNSVDQFGGGLMVADGVSTLMNVTVSENQADSYGAGVLNNIGVLFLTNVTISGNSAPTYTGLANIGAGAEATVLNSTIAANLVIGGGTRYGGVVNSDAVISIKNTIVANNGGRNCLASGTWTSLGNNMGSDNYCAFTQSGDVMNIDPLLGSLGNYGGGTQVHALLPGSPAIDHGNNSGCPATDQRGVARPVDGDNDGAATCDLGAFEARNQLTISGVSVTEGNSGATDAVFTVTLSPTSTQAVSVDYATADGTAAAGSDYTAASNTLNFAPGQATRTITISILGDTDDEPDENFLVNLSNAVNADILIGQGNGAIIDDDGLSALSIHDVSVNEGDTGSSTATFTVSLSPAAAQTVTVNYATSNGSAQSGSDYTTASGLLTFQPGQTSQTFDVAILGDNIDEVNEENFAVTLSNPANANLTDGAGNGTIVDDDIAQVSVNNPPATLEGNSGSSELIFTVVLTRPAAFPVSVDYMTSSGSGGNFATPGVDYLDVSGTLTFAPGETSREAPVTIYGDLDYEEDEVFSFTISNASPISIYGAAALGNISNDDETRIYLPIVMRR
jgi:hypothetical protein